MDLVRFLGDEIDIAVYGDGLIAWMLECGAKQVATDTSTDTLTLE
jgi:hypothetical protein